MYIKSRKKGIGIQFTLNQLVTFLILFFIWIATINYCDVDDYYVYKNEYQIIQSGGFRRQSWELGFDLILKFFVRLGLPFEMFYAVFMSIFLFLMWKFFKYFLQDCPYVWVLFIIIPYIQYLQQIRSAMAMVLVMNLLIYLLNSQDIKFIKAIKFSCALLVPFLIHSSSIICITFLLVLFINKGKLKKIIVTLYIFIPILIDKFYPIIVNILKQYDAFYRFTAGLGDQIYFAKFSIIFYLLFGALLLLVLYLDYVSKANDEIVNKLYTISLIIILFGTTVFISDSAYRISIMLLPVIFVTIILMARNMKKRVDRIIAYSGILVFNIVIFLFFWGPMNPEMNYRLMNEMWRIHP